MDAREGSLDSDASLVGAILGSMGSSDTKTKGAFVNPLSVTAASFPVGMPILVGSDGSEASVTPFVSLGASSASVVVADISSIRCEGATAVCCVILESVGVDLLFGSNEAVSLVPPVRAYASGSAVSDANSGGVLQIESADSCSVDTISISKSVVGEGTAELR